MQSLSNAAFFHGVCEDSFERELHIELTTKRMLKPGEFLYVEGEIGSEIQSFIGLVADLQHPLARITLTSGVTVRESRSTGRMLLRDVVGKVINDSGQHAIDICDGSEFGLGFNFFCPLEKGSTVQISLDTSFGSVDILGKVMNCRRVRFDEDTHRIGIQIVGMDRISQARWKRVLLMER